MNKSLRALIIFLCFTCILIIAISCNVKADTPKKISPSEIEEKPLKAGVKLSEEFKAYCYQFANRYHLNDSIWISFEEVIDATPFSKNISNEIQFLRNKKLETASDDFYTYYLLVKDYKLNQEISPFDFVKSRIRNVIINQRKIKLIRNLEEEIYSNAIKNKSFETFY